MCTDQIFILKQIGEKAYDKVNREALWQMLRMYDVGGKLLNEIKSIYVNSLACIRVKVGCKVVSCHLGSSMFISLQ